MNVIEEVLRQMGDLLRDNRNPEILLIGYSQEAQLFTGYAQHVDLRPGKRITFMGMMVIVARDWSGVSVLSGDMFTEIDE